MDSLCGIQSYLEHNIDLQDPLGQVVFCMQQLIEAKVLYHLEACFEPMATSKNEPVAYIIDGNVLRDVVSPILDNV